MRHRSAAVLSIFTLFVASCAEPGIFAQPAPPGAAPTASADVAAEAPNGSTVRVVGTGPFQVPASSELFVCTYTDLVAEQDLAVQSVQGTMKKHGHHVTVFFSTLPGPPGQGDCSKIMNPEVQQLAPAPTIQPFTFETGSARRVPKGAQIVLHSHYINTEDVPIVGDDTATLVFVDPATAGVVLDNFHFSIKDFSIPAQSDYSVTQRCVVGTDLQVTQLAGHMHNQGTHIRVDVVNTDDAVLKSLIDADMVGGVEGEMPGNGFPLTAPLVIAKGALLRLTCTWKNDSPLSLTYPTEMCETSMVYFPSQGELYCEPVAEER